MNNVLKAIKRLIICGNYQFTIKAEIEIETDGLLIEDAIESILNATDINKVINSTNPRTDEKEKLYIIKGCTYDNILIYTKGKIFKDEDGEKFYILISSKRSL